MAPTSPVSPQARHPKLDPAFFHAHSSGSRGGRGGGTHHALESTSSSTSSTNSNSSSQAFPRDLNIVPASSPGPPPSPRRHTGGVLLSRVRARSQVPSSSDARYRSDDEDGQEDDDTDDSRLAGSKSLGSLTGLERSLTEGAPGRLPAAIAGAKGDRTSGHPHDDRHSQFDSANNSARWYYSQTHPPPPPTSSDHPTQHPSMPSTLPRSPNYGKRNSSLPSSSSFSNSHPTTDLQPLMQPNLLGVGGSSPHLVVLTPTTQEWKDMRYGRGPGSAGRRPTAGSLANGDHDVVDDPLSDSDEDDDDDESDDEDAPLSWSTKRRQPIRPPTPPRPSTSSRKSSTSTRPSHSRTVTVDHLPAYVENSSSAPPTASATADLSRSFGADDFHRLTGRPWEGPAPSPVLEDFDWGGNSIRRTGVRSEGEHGEDRELDEEVDDLETDEDDPDGGMIGRSKKFRDARNAKSLDLTGSESWGGSGITQIGTLGFGSFGGGGGLGGGDVQQFGRGLGLGEMPPPSDHEGSSAEEEKEGEENEADRTLTSSNGVGATTPGLDDRRPSYHTSSPPPPSSFRPLPSTRSSPTLATAGLLSPPPSSRLSQSPSPPSAHHPHLHHHHLHHPHPHPHSTTPHHPSPLHALPGSKTPPGPTPTHSRPSSPPMSPRNSRRRVSQKSQRLSSIAGRQLPSPFASSQLAAFSPFPAMTPGGGIVPGSGHSMGGEGGYPFPASTPGGATKLKVPPYLRDGDRGESTTSILSLAPSIGPPSDRDNETPPPVVGPGKSIDDYVITSEAGRGAYGLVKRARKMGPDGRAEGPEVIIKMIIKQRILADSWKKHRLLGPIPIEIHIMDQVSKFRYIPPPLGRPWDPRRPGGPPKEAAEHDDNTPTAEEKEKNLAVAADHSEGKEATTPTAGDGELHVGPHGELYLRGHPNVCTILDFFEDREFYFLVMPRFGIGQDLFDRVEGEPDGLPSFEVRSLLGQISDGLAFLHQQGIVHRDIKDENVILDGEGHCQLIDFGSAAHWKPGRMWDTFSGTLDYASPEILRGEKYSGKEQDVWALGVVGYVLLCGETPFVSSEEAMLGFQVGSRAEAGLRERCFGGEKNAGREADGGGGLEDAMDWVERCCEDELRERPNAEQLLTHRFLKGEGGWTGRRGWEEEDGVIGSPMPPQE